MNNVQHGTVRPLRDGSDGGADFEHGLLELVPFLRAFSYSLCHDRSFAEDAAQDALTSAWRARGSFKMGTNLKAWLCTILRNQHTSHQRRAWRQTYLDPEVAASIPSPPDEQAWADELSDLMRAAHCLLPGQLEALILVSVAGHTYKQAAAICHVAEGTMKSRVARGRQGLAKMLNGDTPLRITRASDRQSGLNQLLAQLDKHTGFAAPGIGSIRVEGTLLCNPEHPRQRIHRSSPCDSKPRHPVSTGRFLHLPRRITACRLG
jgi:RNA polymerase sigma-70 factor (ECF subfamily)